MDFAIFLIVLLGVQGRVAYSAPGDASKNAPAGAPAGAPVCQSSERPVSTEGLKKKIYEEYLSQNPAIVQAIEIGSWSALEREQFWALIDNLERTEGRLPAIPPRPDLQNNREEAWHRTLFLRKTAFSMWLELRGKLPWSLRDYSAKDLPKLLSYKNTVQTASLDYLHYIEEPDSAFGAQKFLGKTQAETVRKTATWVGTSVDHRVVDSEKSKPPAFVYKTPTPENYLEFLKGGRIGNCHIVGDFMCVSAQVLNIPCETRFVSAVRPQVGPTSPDVLKRRWDNHRYIDFPSEKLLIAHGDNPYAEKRGSVVFVRPQQRQEFFSGLESGGEEGLRRAEAVADQVQVFQWFTGYLIPDKKSEAEILKLLGDVPPESFRDLAEKDLKSLNVWGVSPRVLDELRRRISLARR
ncbi:hypothetical protein WDW86_07510 [Bdellovibrionota bacterium FG-2]